MLKLKKILALSLIPQYLVVQFLSYYPDFIEIIYSNYIYTYISAFLRSISIKIPFAIGDIFYLFVSIFSIYWIVLNIKSPKKLFVEIFAGISVIYFFFNISWGLNYYRIPINKQIEDVNYSYEDLNKFTTELIQKINKLHNKLTVSDTLKVVLPYNFKENSKIAINSYIKLSKKNMSNNNENSLMIKSLKSISNFTNRKNNENIKASIISYPLTYMGFSGYLNPFTHEYNINRLIPNNSIPMVMSHEIAHEIGFSSEMEANFIGYIALISSDNLYYQYFGNTFALRQCLSELQKDNKEIYNSHLSSINRGILKNYREIFEFWDNYNNPLEPIIKKIYDSFLKINKVKNGIRSYNQSLSLILNYNKFYND